MVIWSCGERNAVIGAGHNITNIMTSADATRQTFKHGMLVRVCTVGAAEQERLQESYWQGSGGALISCAHQASHRIVNRHRQAGRPTTRRTDQSIFISHCRLPMPTFLDSNRSTHRIDMMIDTRRSNQIPVIFIYVCSSDALIGIKGANKDE